MFVLRTMREAYLGTWIEQIKTSSLKNWKQLENTKQEMNYAPYFEVVKRPLLIIQRALTQ